MFTAVIFIYSALCIQGLHVYIYIYIYIGSLVFRFLECFGFRVCVQFSLELV